MSAYMMQYSVARTKKILIVGGIESFASEIHPYPCFSTWIVITIRVVDRQCSKPILILDRYIHIHFVGAYLLLIDLLETGYAPTYILDKGLNIHSSIKFIGRNRYFSLSL